jgi:hypothetical protein
MGMKPRMNEHALPIPGTVNQPKAVDEFANISGTVSTLKKTSDTPIPNTVAQKQSPKTF